MKVLVTGSSGRLGRSLQRRLEQTRGVEPSYLISPRAAARSGREHPVDLLDRSALLGVFEATRPDAVIHLASVTGARCEEDPALAQAVNVDSVSALIELASEFGTTRLVFASSAVVYGDQSENPLSESSPVVPTSVYAETKWRAEQLLGASEGLETVALRIFNVFGDEFEQSLVWRLLHSTAEAPVALRGPRNFVRDYVHVEDVVDAILTAIDAPLSTPHETVNIGSGIPTSNANLIDQLGRRAPLHFRIQEGPRSYSCADISHAERLLQFAPSRRP